MNYLSEIGAKIRLWLSLAMNYLSEIGAKIRLWPWLSLALFTAAVVAVYRPSMIGLLAWSLCKLSFGAGLGYWIDRSIARGPRPHELDGEAKDRALLRRAIIVASAILAMALGP